jgi:hypothetical protein
MKKKSSFMFAIRDGEGYWFSRFDDDGEVFFVSPEAAKQYDNAVKALTERDALARSGSNRRPAAVRRASAALAGSTMSCCSAGLSGWGSRTRISRRTRPNLSPSPREGLIPGFARSAWRRERVARNSTRPTTGEV